MSAPESSGTGYVDLERGVLAAFARSVSAGRETLARNGAYLMGRESLDACRQASVEDVARGLDDQALLSVVSSKTSLLDLDERAYGMTPSPRASLRTAVERSLFHGLEATARSVMVEGQDVDTLPGVAARALVAIETLARDGTGYQLVEEARVHLVGDGWGDADVVALAIHAAAFLADNGRPGLANDLRAALDAREDVMARETSPSPRA